MPTGSVTITPGKILSNNETIDNTKLNQGFLPSAQVDEDSITDRELDEDSVRTLLLTIGTGKFIQSTDFVSALFLDGSLTVGSTTFISNTAAFVAGDVGSRVVGTHIQEGTTIDQVADPITVVLNKAPMVDYSDGVLANTDLQSATAVFVLGDVGKAITGPNFSDGTTISAYVSATEVTLNQAGTDGTALTFQINTRQESDVVFQIVGRGVGWRAWTDANGVGQIEDYRGVQASAISVGAFQVDADGRMFIGSGDAMLRAYVSGSHVWGSAATVFGVRWDGKIWSGAEVYEDASTKIGENGLVTILDRSDIQHNIQTGVFDPTVAALVMNPDGGVFTNPTNLVLTCPTHYSRIYYRSVAKDGVSNTDSSYVSATAVFTVKDVGKDIVGTNIPAGAFIKTVTNATTIVLSANTTGTGTALEFYIIPKTDDTLYVDGTPIVLTTAVKIAARAYKNGEYSAVNAKLFGIDSGTVPNPTVTPAAGSFGGGPLTVTMACSLSGSNLRYTTDGTSPSDVAGTLISATSGTVVLPVGTTTLKVIAFKTALTNSGIVTGVYVVSSGGTGGGKVVTPVFSPDGFTSAGHGSQSVTISTTTTTNLDMRYTKDGTLPTRTHGTLISGHTGTATISANVSTLLKAIAYKTDSPPSLLDSDIKSALYDFTSGGSGGGGGGGGGGSGGGGHNGL